MSSKTPRPLLSDTLLIVPLAHTRVVHVSFQTLMYELFHRTTGGRVGHLIGTPVVLFGALVLTSCVPGEAAEGLAIGLSLAITAWGFAVDRLAGLATAIVLALLATGAFALARALGAEAASAGVACMAGGCAVQTLSHTFEDVPPPMSGSATKTML